MPSPAHEVYQRHLANWCETHHCPDLDARIEVDLDKLSMLWALDLEPARAVLRSCYAKSPRGGNPKDPILLLRMFLVSALFGPRKVNAFIAVLTHDAYLRALCGIPDEENRPGVGTLYDFLHRVHDGPMVVGQVRNSVQEAKRAEQPKLPYFVEKKLKKKKKEKEDKAEERRELTTKQIIEVLEQTRDQFNPNDLIQRLNTILWECGVLASVQRGVIPSLAELDVAGDGSPLPTNASGLGNRTCSCDKKKRCDCPRPIADGDAAIGYDKYRKQPFFGHLFYNILVVSKDVELPVFDSIHPGNVSDFHAAPPAFERLSKTVHAYDGSLNHAILDKGCDGRANHQHLRDLGILPIIAIRNNAPPVHPSRPDVALSKRGIPLCAAGVEMAAWGTSGKARPSFVCPVKAKKMGVCPIAPAEEPGWLCEPKSRLGPSRSIKTDDNPRLFPEVSRNSPTFERLYALRSGCERNNATKKEVWGLTECGHRRQSLWLCQISFRSLLQHARAWLTDTLRAEVRSALLGTGPP